MKWVGIVLLLSGCQLSQSDQAAIGSFGHIIAQYECAKLSPDAALNLICVDAAGIAVTVAVAKAQGILATKRITKG